MATPHETSSTDSTGVIDQIGATSLLTAALRARETQRPDRVSTDPFAQAFVTAAGQEVPPQAVAFLDLMSDQAAVRTRFLDEHLLGTGCRQVVLLACGMDSRALRLGWPSGTTVFEVDQAPVLAFKNRVLDEDGAQPQCTRICVAVDLRADWIDALRSAGFDADRPTSWLTEGLLYALDEPAAEKLLAEITAASAPGSTLAADHIETTTALLEALHELGTDLERLWLGGPADPGTWLTRHGWTPQVYELVDIAAPLGRTAPSAYSPTNPGSGHSWLVTATR